MCRRVLMIWELINIKHDGYISDGLVFYFCFLKGRSISLGRERGMHRAMNHFVLCPLINWPKFGHGVEEEKDMQEHSGWCKRKQKEKQNTFLSRICVSIMKQILVTIWQNHSCKNIDCFLSTNYCWLQWANEQISPYLFPFSSASTKDVLISLYHWHKNV